MTASDRSFPKKFRITLQRDFDAVFNLGRTCSDHLLVVTARRNQLDYPRLGCFVSKRLGHAVFRNRCKRILRESFRLARKELPTSLDLIFRPKTRQRLELESTMQSVIRLAQKMDRLLPPPPDDTGRTGDVSTS